MEIAILSDTHDNIWALAEAMPYLQNADAVLHCGDLCSPFVVARLGEGLAGKPVHVIWGNNDGDQRMLTLAAQKAGNVHIHGPFAVLKLDELGVAMNHYPDIARGLAGSGRFDLVCYGHDHTAHSEQIAGTLLLNPGEIMGLNGRRSLVLYNTSSRNLEWVWLSE